MTHLIRVDREHTHPQQLSHQTQNARIEPRGFAIAKGVVEVEATLHAFADRQAFKVSNGHAVLKHHRRLISAQWQTILGRHPHHVDNCAATNFGLYYPTSIAKREA